MFATDNDKIYMFARNKKTCIPPFCDHKLQRQLAKSICRHLFQTVMACPLPAFKVCEWKERLNGTG